MPSIRDYLNNVRQTRQAAELQYGQGSPQAEAIHPRFTDQGTVEMQGAFGGMTGQIGSQPGQAPAMMLEEKTNWEQMMGNRAVPGPGETPQRKMTQIELATAEPNKLLMERWEQDLPGLFRIYAADPNLRGGRGGFDEAAKQRFRQVALSYLGNLGKAVDGQVKSAKEAMMKLQEEIRKRPDELVAAYYKSGSMEPFEEWATKHMQMVEEAKAKLGAIPSAQQGVQATGGGMDPRSFSRGSGAGFQKAEGYKDDGSPEGILSGQEGSNVEGAIPTQSQGKTSGMTADSAYAKAIEIGKALRPGTGKKVSDQDKAFFTKYRSAAEAVRNKYGRDKSDEFLIQETFKQLSKSMK